MPHLHREFPILPDDQKYLVALARWNTSFTLASECQPTGELEIRPSPASVAAEKLLWKYIRGWPPRPRPQPLSPPIELPWREALLQVIAFGLLPACIVILLSLRGEFRGKRLRRRLLRPDEWGVFLSNRFPTEPIDLLAFPAPERPSRTVQLIPESTFDALGDEFAARRPILGESYRLELLDEPVSGRCLRNYLLLTECPELFGSVGELEVFWQRYYWLRRYAIAWRAVDPEGYDPSVEDMLIDLLEGGASFDEEVDHYSRIESAAERDARHQLREANLIE
jgi:hypothetical protein